MGPDPKKIEALEQKMAGLGVRHGDITTRFIKSSGRGGQKVNKSSSAVFLRHEPTGISVKLGKHRSQHLNRFLALRTLVEKLEIRLRGVPDKDAEKLARIRKQKIRRKKRARKKTGASGDTGHPQANAGNTGIRSE